VNNGLHGKPVEEWLPIGIIKGWFKRMI
jgi:hypothetical protein